jgi:hypothetical protein
VDEINVGVAVADMSVVMERWQTIEHNSDIRNSQYCQSYKLLLNLP